MSFASTRNNLPFEMAPHMLHNSLYSAQGSCSPFLLPPNSTPIIFDSVYYPSVDCQSRAYYDAPREVTGISGSMGVYGGFRQTMSLEPQSPIGLPSLGPALQPAPLLNYLGCPVRK